MLLSLLGCEPLSHFHRLVSLFSAWLEANDLPANLDSDSSASGPEALQVLKHASMRCGGCGAKVNLVHYFFFFSMQMNLDNTRIDQENIKMKM